MHNSNFIVISFLSHPNINKPITTKFYTCHNSYAVVACAKIYNDQIFRIWITWKINYFQIWVVSEKLLLKCSPDSGWHFLLLTSMRSYQPELWLQQAIGAAKWAYQACLEECQTQQGGSDCSRFQLWFNSSCWFFLKCNISDSHDSRVWYQICQ